jgi:hypothetical protein
MITCPRCGRIDEWHINSKGVRVCKCLTVIPLTVTERIQAAQRGEIVVKTLPKKQVDEIPDEQLGLKGLME